MTAHVLFLSPMCLLDTGSGAALSVRSWLEVLAAQGYQCESLSMTVFDGSHEYRLPSVVGKAAAAAENYGKLLQTNCNGVRHTLFYTRSTNGAQVTRAEQQQFLAAAAAALAQKQPEIVVSYGSSDFTKKLQHAARRNCRRFVFYVANARFTDPGLFAPADAIVCPSAFLADHYRRTLNLEPHVIPTVIRPESFVDGNGSIGSDRANRRLGFITYINPQPDKGLTLFLRLTQMAQMRRSDLTFLAVEGRVSRSQLQKIGVDPASAPNVWWLPNQHDIRQVYRRTSLLLCPSFCAEAAGRIIAEAQLSGIPVLAANRGGIPEQLNGGGFLFDIPRRCVEDFWKVPTEAEVQPWLDTIGRLMDDDAAYADAVDRAVTGATPFLPERGREAVLGFFDQLMNAKG